METISIRMNEGMIKKLNPLMKKHHFATLTEFIRDAIRSKIKELEKEEILKNIEKLAGSSRRKTSDEELHNAGEKVFEKLEKKFNFS